LIDIQHTVQQVDVWPGYQQFRVDDDVDVKRVAFAGDLKRIDGPFMPGTGPIDAIDPDIGINEDPSRPVVVDETSERHGVRSL
jgi:hypothetical protein